MPAIPNPRVILAKVPVEYPVAGEHIVLDTSHTIDPHTAPLNGGFLTKTLLIRFGTLFVFFTLVSSIDTAPTVPNRSCASGCANGRSLVTLQQTCSVRRKCHTCCTVHTALVSSPLCEQACWPDLGRRVAFGKGRRQSRRPYVRYVHLGGIHRAAIRRRYAKSCEQLHIFNTDDWLQGVSSTSQRTGHRSRLTWILWSYK